MAIACERRARRLAPCSLALAVLVLAAVVPAWTVPGLAQSWEDLGPEGQREALRNFQHYQRAPQGTRKRLDTQWQRFQELDPAEKDRLRRNLERWRQLPPDTKQELNDRYRSLRQGGR